MKGIVVLALSAAGLVALVLDGNPAAQAPRSRFDSPVKISKEQVQLLNDEAGHVTARSRDLRSAPAAAAANVPPWLANSQQGRQKPLPDRARIVNTIFSEKGNIERVGAKFISMAITPEQREAGTAFFGELAKLHARVDLPGDPNAALWSAVGFLNLSAAAYSAVAASESLTFNLEVRSTPAEATVTYRRTGDPYQPHPDPTSTTLKNLLYAVWAVRAELKGKVQEKEHNPYVDSNHVVLFVF